MLLGEDHKFDNNSEDYSWLRLSDKEFDKILQSDFNPLTNRSELEHKNIGLREMYIMSQPDYFYFFGKVLLNIDFLPMQIAVLRELWNHPYNILMASRGFSKTFSLAVLCLMKMVLHPGIKIIGVGAAFRQSKLIWNYMQEIWDNAPVLRSLYTGDANGPKLSTDQARFVMGKSLARFVPLGCLAPDSLVTTNNGIFRIKDLQTREKSRVWSDGKFRDIGYFYNNGISDVYKITTGIGTEITCTPKHKFRVIRNNLEQWVEAKNLQPSDHLMIDRTNRWPENPDYYIDDDCAYSLGLMLGDGSFTSQYYLRYTTIDNEFLNVLNNSIGYFKPAGDGLHYNYFGKKNVAKWKNFWGLGSEKAHQKYLPSKLLQSNKSAVRNCLSGLFDTDGTIQTNYYKGGWQGSVRYYTTSKQLAQQVQYCLLHFGIIGRINVRESRKSPRTDNMTRESYEIIISGKYIKLFYEQIGFRLTRKAIKLHNFVHNKKRWQDWDFIPIDKNVLLKICDDNDILRGKFNSYKSFNISRIQQINKQIKANGGKSDILDQFKENIFYDSVKRIEKLDEQIQTYDLNVPDNNLYIANGLVTHNTGDKIRGLRAQIILADEFDSINLEIFERIIEGFMVVRSKPIDNVKRLAYIKRQKEKGLWTPEKDDGKIALRNQSIISGTVGDINGNLQSYFERYSAIIKSQGDPRVFREHFGDKVPEKIDFTDFCVIRIPYEHVDPGFMDDETLAKMKATMEIGTFQAEYGCCPITDTNGFYKKSLIDGRTASPKNIESEYWPEWCKEEFNGLIMGSPKYKYVYGIDPAHSSDNFAITIIEIRENHSRVVYCWTTNKKAFEKGQGKNTKEENYWAYCARKIRNLMLKFPTENIVVDSQGGGNAIVEALRDKDKYNEEDGERPIWPIIDPDKPAETDNRAGLHILHVTNMSQPWNAEANHNLHKDLSDYILLFPYFNDIEAGIADITGEATVSSTDYDRLDDCMLELEELKREIINIVKQQTPTGKERWDTPDRFVAPSARSGEPLRKDRFSSLLLANSVARVLKLRTPNSHAIGLAGFTVGMVGSIQQNGFENPIKNNPYTEKVPKYIHRGIIR